MTQERPLTTAEALVRHLEAQEVRHAFCVPGESYLPVLDALASSSVNVVTCRQEGGMAMMAEACGKATGRPGVCFATRGPGATNAAAGVHVAYQDSTPMILFVGQVKRSHRGRDAWQELDYARVFGGLAKWAVELDDPDRVDEILARAFHEALAGRPGPVVVALPEDVLKLPARSGPLARISAPEPAPTPDAMEELRRRLARSERPLLVLGGSRWTEEARAGARAFAEAFQIPTATSHRRGGLLDWRSPAYAGELGLSPNPELLARVRAADLLILLGGRFGEVPSQGYGLLGAPSPGKDFVHIYPDAEELGRVYQPALAVQAAPGPAAAALAALHPPETLPWAAEFTAARASYLAFSGAATPQPGGVNLGEIVIWLRENLGPLGTVCNGAGNFAGWINRYWRVPERIAHVAPTSGSMGYGFPAALTVKTLHPERRVVAICGDGDFLMTGQEFATAVQHQIPVIAVIADNRSYGTIRMHQEREFPGRVFATELVNPDFAAYARAFGGFGACVAATEEFPAAFAEAEAAGRPAIIHLKIDTDAISPAATLGQIRARALAAGS